MDIHGHEQNSNQHFRIRQTIHVEIDTRVEAQEQAIRLVIGGRPELLRNIADDARGKFLINLPHVLV